MAEKNIYKPIKYKVDKIVTETPLIKTFFISAEKKFEFKTLTKQSKLNLTLYNTLPTLENNKIKLSHPA